MANLNLDPVLLLTVTLLVVAATLTVAIRVAVVSQKQLTAIQAQLSLSRDSSKSHNMLHALSMLRDPEFRTAVMVVRSRLKGRAVETWESGDALHVLQVCSTYNLVGLLLKHDLVPGQLFLEHWGAGIIETYDALEDFITIRRRKNPTYCDDFANLYAQSKAIAVRSAAPSGAMPLQRQTAPIRAFPRSSLVSGR